MPVMHLRLRRSRIASAVLASLVLSAATSAFAQQAATTAPATTTDAATDAKKSELDRVTVVGSRIKRATTEGPAPIVVITRADIDREGFQTVGDMLQTLTQNTTASFTGDLAVTGFTPNAQVVNLRNLGPGYTLTLINGRRPAQYPQPYNRDNNVVNVKAIPSSIIERVEVLTGGASAIYGSDAVAGVVNIVTRKNFDGNFIRATVGTTTNGGGDNANLEYTGGRTGDRWSAVYAFQYGVSEPVFARQRDFLSDTRNGPLGAALTNPALSLIAIRQSGTSSQIGRNAFYPGQDVCDRFGYTTRTTASRGTYCGSFTQPGSRSIQNKSDFWSTYGYGTYDLTDKVQLFGSATYYASRSAGTSGTEFWGTSGDQFNRTSSGGATSVYFDPQFGSLIQLQRVFNPFELGGLEASTTKYDEKTYDVMVGATGNVADRFDWEASAATSRYDYQADRPRLLSQAVHDYFLGPQLGFSNSTGTGAGIYPIYRLNQGRWTTPLTPELYQSLSTRVINKGRTGSSTFNFNVSGDLFDLPAGAVGFAGVLEAARQTFDLESDPRTNQLRPRDAGTIYNLTSSGESHGKRDRYAVGGELRVPILNSLTAQLAGRYDKYDDITAVGGAFTYNLGLEFRPIERLLLRSSYATSFRAPDMQLVFAQGAASFSTILDEYACRSGTGLGQATPATPRTRGQCSGTVGDPTVYSSQTVIAGNPLLKEEEGKSFTAGFVFDVMQGMDVSVDYWRIQLKDAATQLSSSYILANEANCRLGTNPDGSPFANAPGSSFCQNITSLVTRLPPNPGTALDNRIDRINSAYINSALQDSSGIDATYHYKLNTANWGRFALELGYSLSLTNRYRQFPGDQLIDYRDDPSISDQRSRVRGSLGWTKGDWSSTVFGTRYGTNGNWVGQDYTNAAGGFSPRRLPPYMLYNLQVAKKFGPNLTASLTVNNVLDNKYRKDASNTGYPYYDYTIGADPVGRRLYFSLGYKF
ncbi:TonB-dependent receptor domain-containing protein [Cognatilysobacter lacus]|uniref:TonB-dependent receptor n=1 Tax=Cognatilysobacter lacus TaxID=1643323 RepID=A0A5D8Z7U9_9GAMM|nr:TonB-dependent receptor [Lysobacter lacus]TZF90163.1 TonB-dependent receptor [Lysobacter lacus]